MKILFFDTETNGLPKDWKADFTEVSNWPRVIQIAWRVCDEEGKDLRIQTHRITPNGWTIPAEKFWIDNGHTTLKGLQEGIPLSYALHLFSLDFKSADLLVAHNVAFDKPILGAEFIRISKELGFMQKPFYCTMKNTTGICKIPQARGGYKWPKLEELYSFLFSKPLENAHDAGGDTRALADCFFKMVEQNIISLNNIPGQPPKI